MIRLQTLLLTFLSLGLFGDGGDGNSDPGNDATGNGDAEDATTYTRKDLDAAGAGARKKGAAQAKKDLAEQLGVSFDEATKIIEGHNKAQQDALSETDKAKSEAQTARDEAAADRQAAKRERTEATIERKLTRANLDEDALDVALPAVMRQLDADSDQDDIDTAITALKEKLPALFASESTSKNNMTRVVSSTTKKTSSAGTPPATGLAAGREAARKKFRLDDKANA